jgi:two-component system response regulator YesN
MTFSTIDNFYDADMTKLLQQKELYNQGIFIPRKAHFTFPANSTSSKNLISVVYSNLHPDSNRDGMVLNLDQSVLQELITKGSGEGSHKMMIVNDQGMIISHPEGTFLNENESNPAFLQTK